MKIIKLKIEILDQSCCKTTIWIYNLPTHLFPLEPKDNFKTKVRQFKKFLKQVMQIPQDKADKFHIDYIGVLNVWKAYPDIKADFALTHEKFFVAKFIHELALFNKDRKPSIIRSDDLTAEQQKI
uniref:Uncharacterized protein n=1 Tax=Romanomermis culicivorax TaxID=13658 RepID=A0A915IY08_ROMCU